MDDTLRYALLRAGLGRAMSFLSETSLRELWRSKCQGKKIVIIGSKVYVDGSLYKGRAA